MDKKEIGLRIKTIRKEKGLSQKEVFFVYSEPPKILKPT